MSWFSRQLDKGKAFFGKLPVVGQIISAVNDITPSMEQEADVTVYGGPNSTKASLYWCAVAIAFGLVKNRDTAVGRIMPPAGLLMLEYQAELNRVRFKVVHQNSWGAILTTISTPGNEVQLLVGPPDSVIGGEWQWGNPFGTTSGPSTGWVGYHMITNKHTHIDPDSPNPKIARSPAPLGDYVSRARPTTAADPTVRALDPTAWYTNPEYILWASLSEPCGTGDNAFLQPPTPSYIPPVAYPAPIRPGGPPVYIPPFNFSLPLPPLNGSQQPSNPPAPNTNQYGYPTQPTPPY